MSKIDPHDRTDLTGPWAGFGFQGGKMFTPEGHSLEPCDMSWWSLTCNIAREWRAMMSEARPNSAVPAAPMAKALAHKDSNVILLRDAIKARRERRLGAGDHGTAAETSNVVHISRGPKPRQRG